MSEITKNCILEQSRAVGPVKEIEITPHADKLNVVCRVQPEAKHDMKAFMKVFGGVAVSGNLYFVRRKAMSA